MNSSLVGTTGLDGSRFQLCQWIVYVWGSRGTLRVHLRQKTRYDIIITAV